MQNYQLRPKILKKGKEKVFSECGINGNNQQTYHKIEVCMLETLVGKLLQHFVEMRCCTADSIQQMPPSGRRQILSYKEHQTSLYTGDNT